MMVVVDDARLIVEELRDELVKCSAIPAADQILLGGPPYARLDPRRSIAHYGLPAVSPMLTVCVWRHTARRSIHSHCVLNATG